MTTAQYFYRLCDLIKDDWIITYDTEQWWAQDPHDRMFGPFNNPEAMLDEVLSGEHQ